MIRPSDQYRIEEMAELSVSFLPFLPLTPLPIAKRVRYLPLFQLGSLAIPVGYALKTLIHEIRKAT